MTRENKLALIVGFSLLLVVAILLADHLSPAQQGELARLEETSSPSPLVQLPSGMGDQYRRQFGESAAATSFDAPANREITLFEPPQGAMQPTVEGGAGTAPPPAGGSAGPDLDLRTGQASEYEQHVNSGESQAEPIIMGPGPTPVLPESSAGRASGERYVVRDGDTLYGLCRRFYGDGSLYEALLSHNADVIPPTSRLLPGMTIILPQKDVLTGGRTAPPGHTPTAPAAQAPPARSTAIKTIDYTIREDDRLWDLAKKHLGKGGRWHEIVALNRDIIRNPDVLPIGKTIRIPVR